MHNNKKPIANPIMIVREELDSNVTLFNPETGDAFSINPIGFLVWKLLDGTNSIDDMVSEIRTKCNNIPDEAIKHIESFINELLEKGFAGYKQRTI